MAGSRRFNADDYIRPVVDRRLRRLPRLFGRALQVAWRAAPRDVAASTGLQLVAGAGLGAQLLVGRKLIGEILAPGGTTFRAVAPELVAVLAIGALVALAGMGRAETQRLLTERVSRYAADQVLEVSGAVELIAFEHPQFADRLHRAQVNALVRPTQVVNGLLGLVGGMFAAVGIGAALILLQPLFFVLVAVAYVPAWFTAHRGTRLLHDFSVQQTERDRRRAYLFNVLGRRDEAAEVRSFGISSYLRARHDRLYDERIGALQQVVNRRLRLGLAGQVLTTALTGAAAAVLVWQVTSGRVSAATGAAAAGAMVLLGSRLGSLLSGVRQLHESSLFLEDFTGFVDAMPAATARRSGLEAAPPSFERLAVDGVTFRYPSRVEPTIRDVSMEIAAGEVIALVGENGSGKTTLAKLLAGLFAPDAGAVRWDGTDIAAYDPDGLRRAVAVIFQDFARYQLTARDNILLGRPERGSDVGAIRAAAVTAGADELISGLADGYDTRLGPHFLGGTDLSLGQWQRIALARAVFRDAPFVILDEPTSAHDPRAERQLFEGLRTMFAGRTVLFISHRFANVRSADRIYVLAGGRVIEQGTHESLMEHDGLYAELFAMQAASYA